MNVKQGTIVIFTGDGKGKTTAALGLAVGAAANRQRVMIVQFLKGGGYTGELFAASFLEPFLTIKQFGYGCPISAQIKSGEQVCNKCGLCFRENRKAANEFAAKALAAAAEVLADGMIDMLVMDEISHALRHNLISKQTVLSLLLNRPKHIDIVLTGRNMPEELLAIADQVTFCQAVKHPMKQGIDARRGTEY
ncbi:MAG: cob(I)yrinic acid a,c-diamide adenosyltransferase [Sporomusaceae bacterium]|nr:cob(I)yrinic acid a,c-diamide adenosyltransferase [Sporomusaceae bacterium]